jgi:uncharacterized protein YceH (UPF0502 family)
MEKKLSLEAVRVLGVLIEKERSTPDYYPMTVNALVNGCNQKSNRFPVVEYGEIAVIRALDELYTQRLSGHASVAGGRAEKYRHAAAQHWNLDVPSLAVLASLTLRGAQTVGELRTHTTRMASFESMEEVAEVLQALSDREEPLAMQVGRRAGQKGLRFAHLLSGEPIQEEEVSEPPSSTESTADLDELRERLTRLEAEFEAFRKQFE